MSNKNVVPSRWHNFFRHDNNKTKGYQFLADRVAQISVGNMVIVTKDAGVLSSQETDLEGLDKCTHEQAESPYMPGMPQYMQKHHIQS